LFQHYKDWTETTLFTTEIQKANEWYAHLPQGPMYEYIMIDAYKFMKGNVLKDFFEAMVAMKAEAKANGDPAAEAAYKLIANSGYGFFGLRTDGRDGIELYKKTDRSWLKIYDEGSLISYEDVGEYTLVRARKTLGTKNFNVAIASAITSYARLKLYGLIKFIDDSGAKVTYCDTDSIIINKNPLLIPGIEKYIPEAKTWMPWHDKANSICVEYLGTSHLELINNRRDAEVNELLKKHNMPKQPPIPGTDLGSLKNEYAPHPMGYFNKIYIGGPKFYALEGQLKKVYKAKGFSKNQAKAHGTACLDIQMPRYARGEQDSLHTISNSFRTGRRDLMKDMSIKMTMIERNIVGMEHENGGYYKGKLIGQKIVPLISVID
jgi:hypothetical protein